MVNLEPAKMAKGKDIIATWYKTRKWKPFPFQLETAAYYLNGKSGLLNAPTGSGKTYALFLPVLIEWLDKTENFQEQYNNGLQLIWITPLRALSKDIQKAMQQVCEELSIPWRVECRTGDTKQKERAAQKKQMPEVLITTPESLHLLLASKNYPKFFKTLKAIVLDEWHELLGSKRGVQAELALSRLKGLSPNLKIWGISATIGNMEEALQVLLGNTFNIDTVATVIANISKEVEVASVLPDDVDEMPWSGHLGLALLEKVLPIIEKSRSTLLFTNTRSQAEIWYQKLLNVAPHLAGIIAMHHGSIDIKVRQWVESSLAAGTLKAVVCTSSLDLGIDFWPVETVIQIGGAKGIARFSQRAGRSGHQPGAVSKIHFLPTHSLELIEAAALKHALKTKHFEKRVPVINPIDVLVQYAVTIAVGEGMEADKIFKEVRTTYSFANLKEEAWQQVLNFITTGGQSLVQYDEFSRVLKIGDLFKIASRGKAMRHRLQIGTIVGDTMLKVNYVRGKTLGHIEEYFVARLKEGDIFWFAGKALEFVNIKGMTVYVRKSNRKKGIVPQWMGGRMAFSSQLSELFRFKLTEYMEGKNEDIEFKTLKPLLDVQQERSIIPTKNEFLIEYSISRDGHHYFFYPFEGRTVHEGMAAVIGYRIAKQKRSTFSIAMNDYGFELLTDEPIPIEAALEQDLFSTDNLFADIQKSINATEMAKRTFRDIAVIAGLVFQGYPGKYKKGKHLQASSQLIFEVFQQYDEKNLLLQQAFKEVYENQVDEVRMRVAFKRIKNQEIKYIKTEKFSPFAFPIMTDRLRSKFSNEQLSERIKKMMIRH